MARWKNSPIAWTPDPSGEWRPYPGLTQENATWALAWALWQWQLAVPGLVFERTELAAASVILTSEAMPFRSRTAAYSEIPASFNRPCRCILNANMPWCCRNEPPLGFFDVSVVLLHEAGHLIGISDHGPAGTVMAVEYSGLRKLQPWDITRASELYGRAS